MEPEREPSPPGRRPGGPEGPLVRARAFWRRHRLGTVVAMTAVGFLVLGVWRLLERREDAIRRLEREREALARRLAASEVRRLREEGGTLLALAHVEAPREPALALHLALEGAARRPGRAANDTLVHVLDRHREVRRFLGHDGPVAGFDVAGEDRLLTWDRTGLVLGGDLREGTRGARHVVSGLRAAVLRDDGTVVAAGADGRLHVWAVAGDDAAPRVVAVAEEAVTALAPTPTGVVAGTAGGAVLALDLAAADLAPRAFEPAGAAVEALATGPDGEVAALAADGRVLRYDPADGRLRGQGALEPGEGRRASSRLAYAAGGRALVASTAAGALAAWVDGEEVLRLGPGTASGPCLAWAVARDAPRFACRLATGPDPRGPAAIVVYDLLRREGVARLLGLPGGGALPLALDPQGQRMAFPLGPAGPVVVRDVGTPGEVARLAGHEGAIGHLAFLGAGDRLLTGSADRSVRLWQVAPPAEGRGAAEPWSAGFWRPVGFEGLREGAPDGAPGRVLALSPTRGHAWIERPAASPGADTQEPASREGVLVDREGADVFVLEGGTARAVFSASGAASAVLGENGTVDVVPVASPSEAWRPEADRAPVDLALDPEGTTVALVFADGRVEVHTAKEGSPRQAAAHEEPPLRGVALADGGRLFLLTADGALRRVSNGVRVETREDVPADALGLVVTPDGRHVAIATPHALQVRDGDDLSVRFEKPLPEETVEALTLDADAEGVLALSTDRRFLAWPFDVALLARARLPGPVHPQDLVRLEVADPSTLAAVQDRYVDHHASAKDLYGLGRARLVAGRFDEARRRFEEAARLRPDLALGPYGLALVATAEMDQALPGSEEHARALTEALDHLRRALQTGQVPKDEREADPLLAPLRAQPDYAVLGAQ